MTTMLQTLNETVAAYTNSTRSVDYLEHCHYFKDEKCCAIGRCLEDPTNFQTSRMPVTRLDTLYSLESILKPEYRGFPLNFWSALQNLHDMAANWDDKGLSEYGKTAADKIKKAFKL